MHESRTWPDRAFDRSGSPQRLHLDLHPLSGVPGNVRIGGHNGGQRLPYMVNLARGEERPAEGQEVWRHAVVDHAARSVRNVVCSKDRQHARQIVGGGHVDTLDSRVPELGPPQCQVHLTRKSNITGEPPAACDQAHIFEASHLPPDPAIVTQCL